MNIFNDSYKDKLKITLKHLWILQNLDVQK